MNALNHNPANSLDELIRRLRILDIEPSASQLVAVETFCRQLAQYNQHTNLVARCDLPSLIAEHIVDAWSLHPLIAAGLNGQEGSLVDIGSGAGFPGLILAIACPQLKIVLVDSIGKKTRFLQQAVTELHLTNRVTVLNERAEVLGQQKQFRESFHLATARAVGPLDLIAELTIPLLRVKGRLLAQKSQAQLPQEQVLAELALNKLKAQLLEIVPLNTEALGRQHAVMLIEKSTRTPMRYPRCAAQLKKTPLSRL